MKKLIALLLLVPVWVISQTNEQNWVKTKTYKTPTLTTKAAPTPTEAAVQINYFDGLGRPIQQVSQQQSGSGKNIITHIEYDAYNRQPKEYLPVPTSATDMNYTDGNTSKSSTLSFYQSLYGDANPYSEKQFDGSPLNQVIEQAAPGNDWSLTSSHSIKIDRQTNTDTEVVYYKATATWNATLGVYDISMQNPVNYTSGQLYKTITKDENWTSGDNNTTQEFKDKEGRIVLKRTFDNNVAHDTYYVYDQFGNLTYVLPPAVNGAAITTSILDGLCYQYKYDYRNRLVEKKLPSKQWEFMVYDRLDRLVATGPALSPFTNETRSGWLHTKYDVYNRPVLTAWLPVSILNTTTRKSLQDSYTNAVANFSETKTATTTNTTVNGVAFRYSNVALPTTGYHVLTVNYYDDYNFPITPALTIPTTIEGQTVFYNTTNKPIGLSTSTWTRIPETTTLYKAEIQYTLYDEKAHPIRNYTLNQLGGFTQVDSNVEFITGRLNYTITTHKRISTSTVLTIKDTYTYSAQDRLLTHKHKIGTQAEQLIAANSYDEIGKLTSKQVGGTTVALQKVDYTYNIRGWMTGINNVQGLNPTSTEKDLFAFKLNYNKAETASTTSLFNGNISEALWRTASDNTLRKYSFDYDPLNRLKNASFEQPNNIDPANGHFNESLTYDKNGNITTLKRFTRLRLDPYQIDDLTYTYNNNQLQIVLDKTKVTDGFADEAGSNGLTDTTIDYTYDGFGNMITDTNKGITAIVYNHLNLPTKITMGTKGTIEYLYNAMGQKVTKTVTQGTAKTITDYLGGFQYVGGALQYFPHAEGYFKQKTGAVVGTGDYVFHYTDHLGNIRLSYSDLNKDNTIAPTEILEENNYYPFGLKHAGYNSTNTQAGYKYKYNGKELQDELGLNLYDYGARNYDAALGKWMNVDPLIEANPSYTLYHYCSNNPVSRTDPSGMLDDDVFVNKGKDGNLQVSTIKTKDNFDRVVIGNQYVGNTEKGWVKNYVMDNFKGSQSNELTINYGPSADSSKVSLYSTSVLVDIMNESNNSSITINSTARNASGQADAMIGVVKNDSMKGALKLYGSNGDIVLGKYPDRRSMINKINQIGPSKVSNHCADPAKMNVVDVSSWRGGIENPKDFAKAASRNTKTSEVLTPWNSTDKAIHIAIPQPQ